MTIPFCSVAARCARTLAAGLVMIAVAGSAASAASFLPAHSTSPPPNGARMLCSHYDWACRVPSGDRLTEA